MDLYLPLQLQREYSDPFAFGGIRDALALRIAHREDGPRIQALVRAQSTDSRYHRFFIPLHELPPPLLERFTSADPRSALTILAIAQLPSGETPVAMAQYVAAPYPDRCEIGLLVDDAWQGKGIGTGLLQVLQRLAGAAGIGCIEGDILAGNGRMTKLVLRLGYSLAPAGGPIVRASLRLRPD